jgi:RNA polymerase sigma factor (TIGR02999 family)
VRELIDVGAKDHSARGSRVAADRPGGVEALADACVPDQPEAEVAELLAAWQGGDAGAPAALWQVLYVELKRLARSVLAARGSSERRGATSLVHDAYLRLVEANVAWSDRGHFFAVAARAMRFVLVDEARRQLTQKRGSGDPADLEVDAAEVPDPQRHRPEEVLAIHQVLAKLRHTQPRVERLVELRYFADLSVEETAQILGVTTRTVVRDWRSARLWLHRELSASS